MPVQFQERECPAPPDVLLHGFPQTWYAWRKQTPAFAEHYVLIAPDLRGYGATDKPPIG